MKRLVLLVSLISCYISAFSQGEIPVDMHTGQPSIGIPIWQIQDYDIVTPVTLKYNTSGIKQEEKGTNFGLGWSLAGGGSITREVRGLPDDFMGAGSDTRMGWFYSTCASQTLNFGNVSDLTANCPNSDETGDFNTIDGFNYKADTEPDIFHYEIGGLSGDFVLDNSLGIRLMPLRDILISFSKAANGPITSFTMTTDNGFVYTFDVQVTMTRGISTTLSNVEYLKRDLQLYDAGLPPVTYSIEWKLGKINSPSGAQTTFWYIGGVLTGDQKLINIAIRNNAHPVNYTPAGTFDTKTIYTINESSPEVRLSSITASTGQSVVVYYISDTAPASSITLFDNRRLPSSTFVKQFTLQYATYAVSGRTFLTSVAESSGCDQVPPYSFVYMGVNPNDMSYDPVSANLNSLDFWGYYNGRNNTSLFPTLYVYPVLSGAERYRIHPIPGYSSENYTLNGADRTTNPAVVTKGVLEAISYPPGGGNDL